MNYTVLSDNFEAPKGTVLTDEQLEGCNIAALVGGGHLAVNDEPSGLSSATATIPENPEGSPASVPDASQLQEVENELRTLEQTVEGLVPPVASQPGQPPTDPPTPTGEQPPV